MLGGSSSMDHLMYDRGTSGDYNEWSAAGNKGWDWDTALKYFKKSEKMIRKSILNGPTSEYHCGKGISSVDGHNVNSDFTRKENIMLKIFEEIGLKTLWDINIPQPNGTAKLNIKVTEQPPRRASVAQEYLLPIKGRNNLYLLKNSLATKIIINENKETIGVKITTESAEINVYADVEVIMTAGVFNTPQLLMLSGIGPKEHLQELNINVIKDLPVGTNFQDHLQVPVVFAGNKTLVSTLDVVLSATELDTLPIPTVGGTYSLDSTESTLQHITGFFGASSPILFYLAYVNLNLNLTISKSIILQHPERELMYNVLIFAKPKSRGRVSLRSTNPKDQPKIVTGVFTEKDDLETIVKSLKHFYKIKETSYFKDAGGDFVRPPLPGCDKLEFTSDDYWRCYAKALVSTLYHPVGTCGMGIVVDSDLRVKGVEKLRIGDASVMPTIPTAKMGVPTVMVAERASDLIKQKYGKTEGYEDFPCH